MQRLYIVLALCACTVLASGTSGNLQQNIAKALAVLPEPWREQVQAQVQTNYERFSQELQAMLKNTDPELLLLVDKEHALPADYVPNDLVTLDASKLTLNKKAMQARRIAAEALYAMAQAAWADGVTLIVSSAYRSYEYQSALFDRYVKEMGEQEASRVSALPGHSQHQLGTAFDFGSITNDFAVSRAGVWMKSNAGRYGFSLSYPKGLEHVTGYSWESWHYRYIGKEAAEFEKKYFLSIQHLMLLFLHAYQQSK